MVMREMENSPGKGMNGQSMVNGKSSHSMLRKTALKSVLLARNVREAVITKALA